MRVLRQLRHARHEPEEATGTATIKAGSLDEPVDFSSAIHIWTASKLPGLQLPEDARQVSGEPDSYAIEKAW